MSMRAFVLFILVLSLGGLYWYVSAIKDERDSALQDVATLSLVVQSQRASLDALQKDKKFVDGQLREWRGERETIVEERQDRRHATKKAHESDAAFSDWARDALPLSVQSGGLLGKKRIGDSD